MTGFQKNHKRTLLLASPTEVPRFLIVVTRFLRLNYGKINIKYTPSPLFLYNRNFFQHPIKIFIKIHGNPKLSKTINDNKYQK